MLFLQNFVQCDGSASLAYLWAESPVTRSTIIVIIIMTIMVSTLTMTIMTVTPGCMGYQSTEQAHMICQLCPGGLGFIVHKILFI